MNQFPLVILLEQQLATSAAPDAETFGQHMRVPLREPLPFDQLGAFASSGAVDGLLAVIGSLSIALVVVMAVCVVARRFADAHFFEPQWRHKSEYW